MFWPIIMSEMANKAKLHSLLEEVPVDEEWKVEK